MAGRERFYLAARIARRPDGDPVKTFVCYLALYARDVLAGRLPGEPRRYLPARAERYARECLLAPRAFHALAEHSLTPRSPGTSASRSSRSLGAAPTSPPIGAARPARGDPRARQPSPAR
jgi:hypothetical protein